MSTLFIVGTPIGNLSDMSYRAIETLKNVDFIAAEDTRVTLKLLNHFDIKKPLISYYEHNLRERGEMIISRIQSGESCAVVSDAGMPCISDPGEDLVRLCREHNIPVRVIPGPSAAISAVALSGLNVTRFTFEGFLSNSKRNRTTHLQGLVDEPRTMIFYEAPHKLCQTLDDFKKFFGGDRTIVIARELTKIYEENFMTTIDGAIEHYKENKPKGEFAIVIDGKTVVVDEITFEDAVQMARELVDADHKPTDASKIVAKQTSFNKSEIYKALLNQ